MLLPWNMRSNQGFQVDTEIKESTIAGAGTGRFTKVPISDGAVIRTDTIQPVDAFIASGGTAEDHTVAVEVKDVADLDKLAAFWGPHDERTKQMMSWFVSGVPGIPALFALSHSFHCNHSQPGNMKPQVRDGCLQFVAVVDIAAGAELITDYTTYGIPPFCKSWMAENGFEDVRTKEQQRNRIEN
eukprot:NODE_2670_length_895_cov_467.423810.p1 GENE.NODE_2670_length_895_cov_467.423810~~NODE_2670_length_895_cov_467.423810.p1  ORF type:complete len:185 (-),score=37.44 NODE_2670_length_895_cov_467.423810:182-736(-)